MPGKHLRLAVQVGAPFVLHRQSTRRGKFLAETDRVVPSRTAKYGNG
ncbi:MAG: hypothetical protein ACRD22_08170 [Terriglobia bacterium]